MNDKLDAAETLARELETSLSNQYGAVLSASDLQRLLAYPSVDAYRQAITRKTVPVPLFTIKHRRGQFALLRDVARFLACQRTGVIYESNQPGGDN